MNPLIKKEKDFLRLLVTTTDKQKKVLLQTIEKSQLRAIVQIVYNLMIGYRTLPEKDKKKKKTIGKKKKRYSPICEPGNFIENEESASLEIS